MRTFVALSLALVALAHGLPQQQRFRGRDGRQLDLAPAAGYGAPEAGVAESAPALYGAPSDAIEARSEPAQATYANNDALEPQASELDARQAGGDPIAMLRDSIPGTPGEDYPIYAEAPETAFTCDGQVNGGYYADPEAQCQVFHICTADSEGGLTKYSFLCPNGTIFNQEYFICDWWFNVDCSKAEELAASRNADLEAARSEAEARIAAEGSLDAAASGASEVIASYGSPRQESSAPISSYGVQDSIREASETVEVISNYGAQ